MDDWHQENALDLTSDVSSMDSDNSTVDRAETSTNSLKQKDLTTDCGVLNHSTTPTGHSSSSFVNFSRPSERLSISQPDLPTVRAAPRAIVAKLNVSAGNISHPFKKPPRTRVPLIKTLEENEALKEEIAILKSKLNLETYKVAELTSLQPRNIQDILDEYYSLQMSKYDVDKERKHIAEAKRQAQSDVELAEVRAQAKVDIMEAKLRDAELQKQRLIDKCEEYEERIEKLEATIAEKEELPTSLDALKGEDSDWTIRSEGDIITDELRVRLTAIEKENNALRKKIEEQQLELAEKSLLNNVTSQIGGGCDVEKLLQQIDNLEIRLHDEEEQHNKTSSALVAYMSRCHTLEKKLQNINLSCAHWSFNGHTKDEVLQVVNKLRNLLRSLGEKNKELREKCTKLLGLKDLSEITTSSTGFDGVVNVAGDVFEKSCLLIENFEEKQQEVINILKSLTDNVTDFDESVIKILREATEASGEQSLHRDALANLINPNCQPNPCETATYQNLSMMGASLSELINRSLNTSKVIVNFQEKLGTLRGVMQRMFENLRTCGMLFEDILKNLGSENDEIRQLVDRIKSMKFECSNVLEESRLLLNVIEETSKSVSMMQLEMSAWEQSLNETSFRMDYSVVPRITHCRATQTVQANEEIDAENLQESLEIRALLSAKEKEIERLQTMIGKITKDCDIASSYGYNLRDEMEQIQTSLTRVEEERDSLKSLLKTAEDEMKLLRDSLEEQVAMNEQVQHDVAKLRSKTGALIQEVDSKDNIITDLKNDLLAAERMCQEMKVVILEREAEAKEIRTVLEEEQERRKNEREDWKSAVLAAQETSSALRYDLEKIRNEFTAKEETIRNLSEQLRIADENNFRMAEVISEHASNERGDLCVRKDINYKSFVNTKDVSKTSTTMVKSRDSQTDITRDALIKMESDSCSLSNEMNVLRVAYVDLSHAVGKLVVKELEPVPNEVDILWIEKSCKELCRLIHHERRRREVQANEVAAMASKLEEMKQKCPMDCTSGVLKEICPTMNTEANKRIFNKKKFCNPMRQTLFVLTTMAVDLVTSLRKLSSLYSSGKQISFLSSIELARNLRNELNDRFLIVRTENENENRHSLVDLIHMVKILEKDNQLLHQNIKSWKDEYEALSAKNANKPELAERIATQLRSIHNVMSESRRACGLLQEAKKETAQPTSASESRQ